MPNHAFPAVPISSLLERVTKPVQVEPEGIYHQIGIRSHGKGIFDKEPVQGRDLGNKRVFWIEPDCFVVNIVFAWEQAVGRTKLKDKGKIASHRFPMFRAKLGKANVDFITYLFKTEYGKELLSLASPGGAGRNKTLGQSEFLKLKIRVPPAAEQQRIAEILSTWDEAIETVEKLIANARDHKHALMQQLFTGKKRLPGFRRKWTTTTLGDRGEFRKGKGISRAEVIDLGIPCVRYGEIYTHHHDVIRKFNSFIGAGSAQQSERIQFGDILFTCSGETAEEIGKCVAYVGHDEAYAGSDIIILSPEQDDPIFLSYLLNSTPLAAQKAQLGQGNSVVHISSANLAKLKFKIPDHSEQQAIGALLLHTDAAIGNLEIQRAALADEKSALMQQLLTGKRRVKFDRKEAA
jgi:type I restriction enzyme S subunit